MLAVRVRGCPWDFVEDDLDRLHGEVGVSGVSTWAAAPPLLQLRASTAPTDPQRLVRTTGGLLFQPHSTHYGATRCKPLTADGIKSRSLDKIAAACTERDLELRAVVSAARVGRIAAQHPEMSSRNAFGDRSSLSVCLVNPDVQAFLAAVVADLASNYPISAVCLTDFYSAWAEAYSHDLRTPIPLGHSGELLLSLCFCESCHQKGTVASVDVAAARRLAQSMLDTLLQHGDETPAPLEPPLVDAETFSGAPEWAEYLRWRDAELDSLLARLVEACAPPLFLYRTLQVHGAHGSGSPPAAASAARRGGHASPSGGTRRVLTEPAGVITAIDTPEQLDGALCSDARNNELCLPARMAIGRHAPELVSTLGRAATMGFSGFEIDDFGSLPTPALTAVKQAIRFARRTEM